MSLPTYTEVSPSPEGEWYEDRKGRRQFRAQRTLLCDWTDVPAMIAYLYSAAGSSYPHPDGTPHSLVRRVKPHARGKTGGTATLASHATALLDVYYDTDGPRWVNGAYVDEAVSPMTIHHRPTGMSLRWSDDTPLSDADLKGVEIEGGQHVLIMARMPSAPSDVFSYVNMCNSGAKNALILGYSWPAQTVRYAVPEVRAHFDYSGGTTYTAIYHHPINPNGWNKFWRGDKAAFETLYRPNGDPYVQYPPSW